MAVSLNGPGASHAHSLIAAGKVDQNSDWSFSAEDGNRLLGDPPKWSEYGRWFLGKDPSANPETKDHWKYPFGKNGKVYRSALRAIASRASAEGAEEISKSASAMLASLDKKSLAVQRRAYSLLSIKSINEDMRQIAGIATTPETDREGDVVEPRGAKFTLPMPLLWQHNSNQPIGHVTDAKVTDEGIQIRAQMVKVDEPGTLKDRLDEAWQSIKSGLVRGLSIGFVPTEYDYSLDSGGMHCSAWDWLELSCVTIPANASANILALKRYDRPAASGTAKAKSTTSPGVSGLPVVSLTATPRAMKKSIAEQIKEFEATRASKDAARTALMDAAAERGETLDAAQAEQHDNLTAEIDSIDSHLKRLRIQDESNKKAAVVVSADPAHASQSRGGSVIVLEKKLPPGIGFARYAMCIGKARGSTSDAVNFAKQFYPDSGIDKLILAKAAVGAGAVVTSHWADDLVPYNILADFIEYLRPGNIIDKFGTANPGGGGDYPGLRKVPFNVRVSGFSAGLTGNWVGEGKPAPLSKATSFNTTLTWAKVEALAALTQEEIRFSNPSAEMKVRDDIAKAINTRMDIDFVDPSKAAVANVSPASITNGVVATAPTGSAASNLITDLVSMVKGFAQNNLDASDVVLIMSAQQALNISMMTTTLGFPYFPDITMKGGTLRGFPVLVSENLTSVGSPGTQTIVAVKASEVYLADDGNVTVDASDQASLEMLDGSLTQDGTAGTGASLVSLWQNGLLGIKASREVTWKMRRSTAVYYISPAAYAA